MFSIFYKFFTDPNVLLTLKWLYYASYVVVPAGLIFIAWELWVFYVRSIFLAKQTYVLLEIKLPRDIFKSPKAMEFCIANMYQTGGEGSLIEKYWKGQVRPWFSLEMVSINNSIHFFIWARKGSKNQIEANLYSQYPGIEIYEVPDYTLPFSFDPEKVGMWASEFKLTKADYFPIKTYVDYKMDQDPKEEYKIDPLTPLIEFLGNVGSGHHAWIQIIIRAHKAEDKDPKTGKLIDAKWAKGAEGEIAKMLDKTKSKKGEDGKETPGSPLTEGNKDTITALERSISKPGFDVGIRAIYSAPKEIFNPSNIGGIIGGITHFNSNLNGFAPTGAPKENWPYLYWIKRKQEKIDRDKQEILDAYKKRAYFYKPHKRPHPFVLNTEELATMFHFPGGVAATPTFSRIESKKSEAPTNLPV